ncbi:hypothetical protein BKA66DRAFT_201697 [Pyrenochaeta sp. MPI-SDFR-AT-0127]|nr:hypothetical protein BKA66DRAFT_201697 [Pyrenochaeta sp. MPI-SDFR-AT-0127]
MLHTVCLKPCFPAFHFFLFVWLLCLHNHRSTLLSPFNLAISFVLLFPVAAPSSRQQPCRFFLSIQSQFFSQKHCTVDTAFQSILCH